MKAFILFLLIPAVAGIFCPTCADEFFMTTNDTRIRELVDLNPPFDWTDNVDWKDLPVCNGTHIFLAECPGYCLNIEFFDKNETFVGAYRLCNMENSVARLDGTSFTILAAPCYFEPCFMDNDSNYGNGTTLAKQREAHLDLILFATVAPFCLVALYITGCLCYKTISSGMKSRRERDERDAFLEEARRRHRMDFHPRESFQMTEILPPPMEMLNSVAYRKPECMSEYEMTDQVYEEVGKGSILI